MTTQELKIKRDTVSDKEKYWYSYDFVEKEFCGFRGMSWEDKMELVLEKYETSGGEYSKETKGSK